MKTETLAKSQVIVQCCACKKVNCNQGWVALPKMIIDQLSQQISHSYCDDCFKELYNKLDLKHK